MSARARVLLFLLAGAAGATAAVQPGVERAAAQVADEPDGQALYVAHCASCHGLDGLGTPVAPSLEGVGPASVDFQLRSGRMPMPVPDRQPVRKPAFFDGEEIRAIVAYLTMLTAGGEPPIPTVRPATGDLSEGQELWAEHCLACHGPAGHGASVGGGQVAPGVHAATPVEIAEAVRVGPGAMPRFGNGVISDEQMDSLVAYLLEVRGAPVRGGFQTQAIGTVVEGFIGWLVGMGLLFIVIRLTGART